ncbi:MAG TPA: hypothetical protein VJ979_08410 [Actinomycetota bacterium]|nr:hypothetical protein [Actinomycetota bacterium]
MSDYVDPFPGRLERSPADVGREDGDGSQVAQWPDVAFEDILAEVEESQRADLEEMA